jgi:predicted SAM-dependent methyltransferase
MQLVTMAKGFLPASLRRMIRGVIKKIRYRFRLYKIQSAIRKSNGLKIIVGAAESHQKGWFSTNEQWLDITKEIDWIRLFRGKTILTHVVAEHVFEHLTPNETHKALCNICRHLNDGGRIRIAVPDGYNPSEEYIEHVRVGGRGDDAADHKQLMDQDSLKKYLMDAGLSSIEVVEGHDKDGFLTSNSWSSENGYIRRSRQNEDSVDWGFPDASTSLIVDAWK